MSSDRECLGKKYQYKSYGAAKRAAKRKNAAKWAKVTGKRLRSYKCSRCEGYHHTTKPAPTPVRGII